MERYFFSCLGRKQLSRIPGIDKKNDLRGILLDQRKELLRKRTEILGRFDNRRPEGVEKTACLSLGEKGFPLSSLEGPAVRVPPGGEGGKGFVEEPPPRTSRGDNGFKTGHLSSHHHVDEPVRHGDDPDHIHSFKAPRNLGKGENSLFKIFR